jgi:hypothetical protein
VRLDRVLQRAAVDLDRVRHARLGQRSREHDRAHHQVVGERHVRPRALGHLADRGHVGLEVAVELRLRQVLERAGVEALVAVGDVERQHAADVGPVDGGPGGLAPDLDGQRAAVPVARGVDPVERERVAVLAQQVDLVPAPHERLRQRRVVDVRAGPGEQIAVEDEHAHRAHSTRPAVQGRC